MSSESQEFHVEFMAAQVRKLQEMQREGKTHVDVTIDQLVMLYVENIGLHFHLARLETSVGTAFEFTSLMKNMVEKNQPSPEREPDDGTKK